ncbi:hypothetical protein LPH50_01845 [Xylella taiwanensis]|uniref:Uncharacterized protein n=1 Tax=Xylella taiwanensis TaxID=1444770 RepID=A0ABS8TRU7_9GAMM|nr:hypothetical protein [Xylella taiwanensis]MCD8456987.1 hypothetical protein [Xylella taiwanensis]MCD8459398.1 hypothetical protein [Xylella taiwanensis]MCD8461733.1 hypothetical protein [Xylella taiwanensis]MCD8462236.1 hypothetical protein [Xylella taiwanensis]MCD8466022.1 hypothetical protein [Xylella taiwanensis]
MSVSPSSGVALGSQVMTQYEMRLERVTHGGHDEWQYQEENEECGGMHV